MSADYQYRRIVTTRHEWELFAGRSMADFTAMREAAWGKWKELHPDAPRQLPDDWARVRPSDDGVVIYFEQPEELTARAIIE